MTDCLGLLHPPTVWEQELRRMVGQSGYRVGFAEHELSRLLDLGGAVGGV